MMNFGDVNFPYSESVILLKIVEDVGHIDILDKRWLNQLGDAFFFGENLEEVQLKKRIKVKLADIIIIEKQTFIQYLQLRKFQRLSEQSKKYLFDVLTRIWQKFQMQIQNVNERIMTEYLPNLQKIDQYETYHLNLFLMFQQSPYCPKNQMNLGHYVNYPSIPMVNTSNFGHQMFQPTNPFMMNYGFQGAIQQPYIQGNIQPQNNWNNKIIENNHLYNIQPEFQMTNGPMYYEMMQQNCNITDNQMKPNNQLVIDQDVNGGQRIMMKCQNQIMNINESNQEKDAQKMLLSLNLCYCVCKGVLDAPNLTYFECCVCKYFFHHKCLMISIQTIGKEMKCPGCTLNSPTIFSKVLETIETAWMISQSDKDNWTCYLKKKDILKVTSNPKECEIHLRFLRVDGNINFKDEKQRKKQFFSHLNHHDEKVINSIKINVENVSSHVEELPIQVNPVNEGSMVSQGKRTPELLFFGVYLLKINSVDQIINQVTANKTNHVGSEYINDFFPRNLSKNGQEQVTEISVSLVDPVTGKIINTPVRGSKCTHPQAFDLRGFLQENYVEKEQIPQCPICQKKCQNFIIDDFMKSLIVIDHQGNVPCTVNCYSNGEVRYNQRTMPLNPEKQT